jgi:hypothetical protein
MYCSLCWKTTIDTLLLNLLLKTICLRTPKWSLMHACAHSRNEFGLFLMEAEKGNFRSCENLCSEGSELKFCSEISALNEIL